MKRLYIQLLGLFIGLTSVPALAQSGCLIGQPLDYETLIMSEGTIGQSFTPCQNGTLEFLELWVESTDKTSFAAKLQIWQQEKLIASQQLIVPAKNQSRKVKSWLANPPLVSAGNEYTLEIIVPDGKSFFAYYSPVSNYSEGKMTINALHTFGDLAFEAGIQSEGKKRNFDSAEGNAEGCIPSDFEAKQWIESTRVAKQTFMVCAPTNVKRIALRYKSETRVEGIFIVANKLGTPIFEREFSLPSAPRGEEFGMDVSSINVEPNSLHSIQISITSGEMLLAYSDADPYAKGALISIPQVEGNDLKFSLQTIAPVRAADEPMHTFDAFPRHDCTIAQQNWNETRLVEGPATLDLQLSVCGDGDLEAVYFPIETHSNIPFTLTGKNGEVLSTGMLKQVKGYSPTTAAYFENTQVLGDLTYTLRLEIPEDVSVNVPYSTNRDHILNNAYLNSNLLQVALSYAIGMRPYTVNFEQVENAVNDVTMNVYPNPFLSDFTVEVQGLEGETATFSLYNFQGNEVFTTTVSSMQAMQKVWVAPQGTLLTGYYTLRVEYGSQVMLETVLKQ